MCFLEREVYAFLSAFDKRGERVRGAMLRARIFLFIGGPRKRREVRAAARLRRAEKRSQAICAGAAGRATREGRHVRDAWERGEVVSFSQEKIDEVFAYSSGGGSGAQL